MHCHRNRFTLSALSVLVAGSIIGSCSNGNNNSHIDENSSNEAIHKEHREEVPGGFNASEVLARLNEYSSAYVDLNRDGIEELVVYVDESGSCGSGGCTTYILGTSRGNPRVISRITTTWPPIRVLTTSTNGWSDLAVRVQGGGIHPGYEAKLSYQDGSYPSNPATRPAERLAANTPGRVVISRGSR